MRRHFKRLTTSFEFSLGLSSVQRRLAAPVVFFIFCCRSSIADSETEVVLYRFRRMFHLFVFVLVLAAISCCAFLTGPAVDWHVVNVYLVKE